MTNPVPESKKPALRRHYRALLRGVSPETSAAASGRIAEGIAEWLGSRPEIRRLATFAVLPGEPDLQDLHRLCPSLDLLYPLVRARQRLGFHLVTEIATLKSGRYGIREPDERIHPEVPVLEIDAFLCPGIAFDSSGTRLGRGGGFYDRALETVEPDKSRIGVCLGIQIAEALPRESHDAAMSHLASENGVQALTPSRAGSS